MTAFDSVAEVNEYVSQMLAPDERLACNLSLICLLFTATGEPIGLPSGHWLPDLTGLGRDPFARPEIVSGSTV